MKFVNPAFLLALFSIAIPIIIHLFNFRKFKRIYFTNVKFLKEIKQETQSKSKLKHLLVLASRILALTFLVFAFAQPYIPLNDKKIIEGSNAVSIFMDNSFSMDAINNNGTLLDETRKRAKEIANAYKPSDQFQLLTNDFEGRHQRFVNREEFLQLIDEIKISPAVKNLSEIFSRQQDRLNNSPSLQKKSYIISDFQKSICDVEAIKNDTNIHTVLIPIIAQERNNLYIDSCWFASPVVQLNKSEQLYVRIKNISDKAVENNPIKLFLNNQQKTPASFNIEANSTSDIPLSFSVKEPGMYQCRIELNDYPVTFDDKFYFSFTVARYISVLSINASMPENESGDSYLRSLFGKDSLFQFKESPENNIDYSSLSTNNLIILNGLNSVSSGLGQELKTFMDNGGDLLVFPGTESNINSYKDFLSSLNANYFERLDTLNTKVDKINYEHEIYQDVFEKKPENIDLPFVPNHYVLSKNIRSNESYLMKLQNGDVFMAQYELGRGKMYLSSVPLNTDFSNLSKHAIFVPTMYQIALVSASNQNKLFYTIGKDEPIEVSGTTGPTGDAVFHIVSMEKDFDIIPEHKIINSRTMIYTHNQITTAGNYTLNYGPEKTSALAFNYDRKESNLESNTPEELNQELEKAGLGNFRLVEAGSKNLTDLLTEINEGKKLWKLCIILALVFLACETLLLRFWKK